MPKVRQTWALRMRVAASCWLLPVAIAGSISNIGWMPSVLCSPLGFSPASYSNSIFHLDGVRLDTISVR